MFRKKVREYPEQRVMLDEEDFACLVRGGTIIAGNLKIALQDIGYHNMDDAITKADNKIDLYKDHIKTTGVSG